MDSDLQQAVQELADEAPALDWARLRAARARRVRRRRAAAAVAGVVLVAAGAGGGWELHAGRTTPVTIAAEPSPPPSALATPAAPSTVQTLARTVAGLRTVEQSTGLDGVVVSVSGHDGASGDFTHTLTIAAGLDRGLADGMPVVAAGPDRTGLLGRIISAGTHSSVVGLISDTSFSVGVAPQGSSVVATVTGTGGDRALRYDQVDPAAAPALGAELSTTAASSVGASIPVGTLSAAQPTGGGTGATGTLTTYADAASTTAVGVLTARHGDGPTTTVLATAAPTGAPSIVLSGLKVFDVPSDVHYGQGGCNTETATIACWGGLTTDPSAVPVQTSGQSHGRPIIGVDIQAARETAPGLRGAPSSTTTVYPAQGVTITTLRDQAFDFATFDIGGIFVSIRTINEPDALLDDISAAIVSGNS